MEAWQSLQADKYQFNVIVSSVLFEDSCANMEQNETIRGEYVRKFAGSEVVAEVYEVLNSGEGKMKWWHEWPIASNLSQKVISCVEERLHAALAPPRLRSKEIADILMNELVGVDVGQDRGGVIGVRISVLILRLLQDFRVPTIEDFYACRARYEGGGVIGNSRLDRQTLLRMNVGTPSDLARSLVENFSEGAFRLGLEQKYVELDEASGEGGSVKTPVFPFWRNRCGDMALSLVLSPDCDPLCDEFEVYEFRVVLSGTFSELAFEDAKGRVGRAANGLLGLISDAALPSEKIIDPMTVGLAQKITATDLLNDGKVCLNYLVSPEIREMFDFGMRSIVGKEFGKDNKTLCQRIAYAMQLIVDEGQIESNEVGLAVSVFAIEAIVIDPSSKPSEAADCVAALLQPDPEKRKSIKRCVKKIYDVRSGVAHGRGSVVSESQRVAARRIAAAVIRSAVQHCAFVRKMEGNVGEYLHARFSDEIFISYRQGKRVVGVDDLSSIVCE